MKVIVAIDGSENAEAAAAFLAQMHRADPTDVLLVSVIQLPELHHLLASDALADEFVSKRKSECEEALQRAEDLLGKGPGMNVERHTLTGHPGQKLCEFASQQDADLVIVGATGASLLDRVLLGSTSEYVASHCEISVLVVRTAAFPTRNHWLVACDGSAPSRRAFSSLVECGLAQGMELDLCKVVPKPPGLLNEDDATTIRVSLEDEARETMRSLLSAQGLTEKDAALWILEGQHSGEAICNLAEKVGAMAIVLGATGRSLVAKLLLGSVSRYVLQNAPCSVLLGR